MNYDITPSLPLSGELLNPTEGADILAEIYRTNGEAILDKRGRLNDAMLGGIFARLQSASLEGRYSLANGRPLRFFVYNFKPETLAQFGHEDAESDYFHSLALFAANVPEYVARARQEVDILRREFVIDLPEDADDYAVLADKIKFFLRDNHTKRFAMRLGEVLKHFANPERYTDGIFSGDERDPAYPMLVPVFNVPFENKEGQDLGKLLHDYNSKFQDAKALNEEVTRSQVFTPEELSFADQCSEVVELVDSTIYNARSLGTGYIIAAPLFPFNDIRGNYGYTKQSWNRHWWANDTIIDNLERVTPISV